MQLVLAAVKSRRKKNAVIIQDYRKIE